MSRMLRFLEVVVLIIATGLVADAAENLCSKRETACCHVNEFCGKVELLGRICKDLPVVCPDLEKIAPRSSVSSSAFYIMPSQSYSTSQDFTISFSSSIPFEDSTSIEENVSIKEISSISTHSRTITPSSSSSTLLISSTMSTPWPNVVSSIYPYSTHHISYMTSSIAPWLPSQDVPETFRKWLLKEVQEYAKCHYGTKFCALNQECIPLNENCTIHLANDILRNSTSTPWCSNCSTGTFFCPSYMKCINVNQSCSYADLFHWHRNENFSIGPLGLVCGANETYCIFTMSCMPNTTVCEKQIHYNAKRKKAEIVCKLGERFCPYTSSCKKLSDCRAAPSLNLSKALEDDYFGGWAHLCKMQNVVCPAVSHAVVKCAEARDKYDCNFCPDEHTFCTANGLCLKEGKLCCPEGEEKCNYSNSCATPSLCKGYLTSCQSVAKGFYVSSSIDANFSEVQEYEEGFKKNVSQTVINITKIHCIANVSINPGSIHVSFILVPEKGQISEDFQKALAVLQSVIESGNFNVSLPSGLQLTFNAASLVIRPVTPATTSPLATPFSMETPTKSKKNLTVIIVCSVVFGLLFLVIIAVVVNNYSTLRKEKQSGRISLSQSWDLKNADQQSVEMEACGHYNKTDHPGSNNNLIVKL